jgi:hypothetical protein
MAPKFRGVSWLCVQAINVCSLLMREATISSTTLVSTNQAAWCTNQKLRVRMFHPLHITASTAFLLFVLTCHFLASVTARTLIPDKDFTFKHVY